MLGFCTLARHRLATLLEKVQDRPAASLAASRDLLTRSLVAVSLGTIAYLFAQILMFRYGRDQGIYAIVADAMLRGGMPYRDAWDFKPPGIFLVYALTRAVFGRGQWAHPPRRGRSASPRWSARSSILRAASSATGASASSAARSRCSCTRSSSSGTRRSPSRSAACSPPGRSFSPRSSPSERDRPRAQQTARRLGRRRRALRFAGFSKPPLGGGALRVRHLRRRFAPRQKNAAPRSRAMRARARLVHGGGGAMSSCSAPLWFVARGALARALRNALRLHPALHQLGWDGATVPGMIYLAVDEWLVTSRAPTRRRPRGAHLPPLARANAKACCTCSASFVQLVGVAMQGKFFPYHYGASLLLGGLLAGLGAFKLWRARSPGLARRRRFRALVTSSFFARAPRATPQTDSRRAAWRGKR